MSDRSGENQWALPLGSAATGDSAVSEEDAGWWDWVDSGDATSGEPADGGLGVDHGVGGALEVLAVVPEQDEGDPMAGLVAETRRRADRAQMRRRVLARFTSLTAAALALGAVGVGGWFVLGMYQGAPVAGPAPTLVPAHDTASSMAVAPWCAEVRTEGRVVSAQAGDRTSAVGVILFQQYAWYELRDADAVRSVLAPDAVAAPLDATRAAIASTQAGTQHCVTITTIGPDRFNVRIAERHPDDSEIAWEQVVTTADREGGVVITSITGGGS